MIELKDAKMIFDSLQETGTVITQFNGAPKNLSDGFLVAFDVGDTLLREGLTAVNLQSATNRLLAKIDDLVEHNNHRIMFSTRGNDVFIDVMRVVEKREDVDMLVNRHEQHNFWDVVNSELVPIEEGVGIEVDV